MTDENQTYPIAEPDPEPELEPTRPEAAAPVEPSRLVSLDAYRGFVMLAMASAGLGLPAVAKTHPDNPVVTFVARQAEHVAWQGCSFWDLIQPSFMFIVGVAMPWAYANRKAKGEGWWGQFGHAIGRGLVLIALGVFLSSNGAKQTNWTFVNVLTQIGLGYPIVFLVLGWRTGWQIVAALAILAGYWAFFAFQPLPGTPGLWPVTPDYATLLSHWTQGVNAAADFDAFWMNYLPYPDGSGFKVNEGGYTTLNYVPAIATAIFGVVAGRLLRSGKSPKTKLIRLLIAGLVGIAIGTAMNYTVCPVIKRIWTPSWVFVSAGWASLMLAGVYLAVDVWKFRRAAFPMVVIGANSIVMYVMAQLMKPWIKQSMRTHLTTLTYVFDHWLGFGPSIVPKIEASGTVVQGGYGPIYESAAVLFVLWLICLWLYRRKLFVRI